MILIQVFIKGPEPVYIGLDFQDRIRKASERSANPFSFVNRCCTITCGSLVLTVLLSLILAIPIVNSFIYLFVNDNFIFIINYWVLGIKIKRLRS